MEVAVNALQGGRGQSGWDDLVDACRVMSGKTIRLLQIVYGAPLKRLKINADRLVEEVNKFPTHPTNLKDPAAQKKLLDDLKPITDKALRLEKHLNDRAKAAETPAARKQLEDAAKDARKAAQDLVDAVNDALKNPDKPADFSKPLENLRRVADTGRDTAEKTAPPAPKGIQNVPVPPPGSNKGPQQVPKPSTGPKSLKDDLQEAKEQAKALPEIARKNPAHFPEAADRLKEQVDQVRKKAPHNPEQWDREVEQPLQDLIKAGRDAQRPGNPDKGALDKAANDLMRGLDNAVKPPAGGNKNPSAPAHPGNHPSGP